MIRSRYRVNVWLAFADFFCAFGLLMVGLYGGRTKQLHALLGSSTNEKAEVQRTAQEVRDVLRVKREARDVLKRLHSRLQTQKGWENVAYDEENYSILVPEAVLFSLGKSGIPQPQAISQLAAAIQPEGAHFNQFILMITGHTDDYPPSDKALDPAVFNMKLSDDRAKSVAGMLQQRGLNPVKFRITTRGLGHLDPRVSNCVGDPPGVLGIDCLARGLALRLPEETARNRRIELTLGIYSGANAGLPR